MNRKIIFAAAGVLLVALGVFLGVRLLSGGSGNPGSFVDPESGNVVIPADVLTRKALFIPYEVNGQEVELLALEASDGTARTAFNTCQVCYASGRGYYRLDGDTLVCQNCLSRFSPDQVAVQHGGCNPVPITEDYRADADGNVVIPREFLEETAYIFDNWKN